jgi:FkbM family methyltransferase
VLKHIFYLIVARLGIRRLRGHSFFHALLPQSAVIADLGAHRGEFFAAVKSEHSISRALLAEADPALAESLKQTFGGETSVVHAAVGSGNNKGPVVSKGSASPESSTIFTGSAAGCEIADDDDVPTIDLANVISELGGQVDLVKLGIERADLDILQAASASTLDNCAQLTVKFHDNRQPITRSVIDGLCKRMRHEGYRVVNASWPYVDDVLFVNLRRITAIGRLLFRCRMALVNGLFILRGAFFWSIRLLKVVFGLRLQSKPEAVAAFALSHDLINPWQVPSELHRFANIVATLRPKKVMEIGTFKGGTLCVLCRLSSPTADIISVDLPGGKFGGGYNAMRSFLFRSFCKLSQTMHLIRGDSHANETLTRVKSIIQSLDILFIDGDHTYEGVKRDFFAYSPLVRTGGVVAFHDIVEHPKDSGCEVSRFWKEIKQQYRHEEIIENPQQGWAGIGILYMGVAP